MNINTCTYVFNYTALFMTVVLNMTQGLHGITIVYGVGEGLPYPSNPILYNSQA